jgi:asparagine synthase (glutamine-hydrolysing)
MSGICGYLRLDGAPARQTETERQMAAMAHRGPDRSRAWAEGPVALGHLLMRITPEDLSETQPVRDAESGLTLVADLRLDNRGALIGALNLPGEAADWPDSRIVLAAWVRWGDRCLERLIGDFALAVWDGRQRTLTLARDPMGQRSLFYHQGAGLLAFASEVKALWALPDVPRALDHAYLAERLCDAYVGYEDRTHFRDIRMLAGGCCLTVHADGRSETHTYWEPHADPGMIDRPAADYHEAYRAVLGEAVACRLRGFRPAALLFSGGFDSGSIAALAGPVVQRRGQKLLALASVMPEALRGAKDLDTRYWAEACARVMPHLDLRLLTAAGATAIDRLDAMLPIDEGIVTYIDYARHETLRTAAAAGVRRVLDGHGGDLTLNPRGHGYLPMLLLRGRVRHFLREFAAQSRATGDGVYRTMVSEVLKPLAPRVVFEAWDGLHDRQWYRWGERLLRPHFAAAAAAKTGRDPRRFVFRRPGEYRPRGVSLAFLRILQRRAWVPEINIAAAHGLEMAQPFYDRRVVELGLAIPELLYARDGFERAIARTAMRDLLPAEFATRDRSNPWWVPDFVVRHKAAEPAIRTELARLEQAGIAADMLNYDGIRTLLATPAAAPTARLKMATALNALYVARMVEWFERPNR